MVKRWSMVASSPRSRATDWQTLQTCYQVTPVSVVFIESRAPILNLRRSTIHINESGDSASRYIPLKEREGENWDFSVEIVPHAEESYHAMRE